MQVLNQLSEIGCLAVFIGALQDDCDVDVSKKAVTLITKFVEMLKQYKITNEDLSFVNLGSPKVENTKNFFSQISNCSPRNSYCSPQNSYYSPQNSYCSQGNSPNNYGMPQLHEFQNNDNIISFQGNNNNSLIDQDSIIDEILNAQDLKLLETVYNDTDKPVDNSVEIKKRITLSPKDFLQVISGNFENQSKQKEQWIQDIDSFSSLLDDILSEYEPSDINNMDCY